MRAQPPQCNRNIVESGVKHHNHITLGINNNLTFRPAMLILKISRRHI